MADPTPPGVPPGGFRAPEARLASVIIRLATVLRAAPRDFAFKYDEQKPALWAHFDRAERFSVFGSDFFADLLEVIRHPLLASDLTPARREKLRGVERLLVLRRLQGGDMHAGLAAARALALGQTDGPLLVAPVDEAGVRAGWSQAGQRDSLLLKVLHPGRESREPVLTVDCLRDIAAEIEPEEPATAHVLRDLEPLLRDDPTYTRGSTVSILVHLVVGDPRVHPGYGLLMALRSRADVLDHRAASVLSVGGIRADGPFGGTLRKVLGTVDALSRSSGGPRLDRGLGVEFTVDGLDEFLSGESANLAFALLLASEGRSAGARQRLLPHPGTAALGAVEAGGLVREVGRISLGPKLRRLWESGVRRLYVPAAQATECRETLDRLRSGEHEADLAAASESNGRAAAGAPPGDSGRWVALVPAARLEEIALPLHFVTEPRPIGQWAHRSVRRNRVRVEIAAAVLAAILVTLLVLLVPHDVRRVHIEEDAIFVERGRVWGDRLLVPLPGRGLHYRAARAWWGPDRTGNVIIVAVGQELTSKEAPNGRVRVDWFDSDLDTLRHRYLTPDMHYAVSEHDYSPAEMALPITLFDDWDGDGWTEIVVAARNSFFPSPITVWNLEGDVFQEYVHAGHVNSICLVPLAFALGDSLAATMDSAAAHPRARGIAVLAESQQDAACAVFVLPPWVRSGATPSDTLRYRHANLPAVDLPYARIPPSLAALRVGNRRASCKGFEFVPGGSPYLRASIAEFKDRFVVEPEERTVLLRYFDHRMRQYQVAPTQEFCEKYETARRADPSLPATTNEEFARSVETLTYLERGRWVERRVKAWGGCPR